MLCGALLTEAFLFSTEHFGLLLLLLLLHRIGSTFTVTWIYWSWYIGKYFSLVGKCHEIGENGQKQRAKIDRPIKVNEERKYLMHVKKFSVRFFSSPPPPILRSVSVLLVRLRGSFSLCGDFSGFRNFWSLWNQIEGPIAISPSTYMHAAPT